MLGRRSVASYLSPLLLSAIWACSSGEIDRRDELGLETEESSYEVVPVGQEALSNEPDTLALVAEKEVPTEPSGGQTQSDAIAFDPDGEYTVQIGGYSDAKKATEEVRRLGAEGYPAYAIPGPEKKNVRVRIGYFKTRDEAQVFGQRFKEDKGMEFWVDRRANEKF